MRTLAEIQADITALEKDVMHLFICMGGQLWDCVSHHHTHGADPDTHRA